MLHRRIPWKFDYPEGKILVEKEDYVATVVLNDPPMNLNTLESMAELLRVFQLLRYDPEVRAVVVTGAGTRTFNAGSNLKQMITLTGEFRAKKFTLETELMATLEELCKPTICAIEGNCMGGGLELACCCDLRIASSAAVFAVPEVKLGQLPGSGGLFRLPKLIGTSRTLELIYTGMSIDAEEARQIGLINRICEVGKAREVAVELAKEIAKKPPKPMRVSKRFIQANAYKPNDECLRKNLDYVEDIYEDYNSMEGMAAFIEKRPPVFILDEEEVLAEEVKQNTEE